MNKCRQVNKTRQKFDSTNKFPEHHNVEHCSVLYECKVKPRRWSLVECKRPIYFRTQNDHHSYMHMHYSSSCENKVWKSSSAIPEQCSTNNDKINNQANWVLVTIWVCNIPEHGVGIFSGFISTVMISQWQVLNMIRPCSVLFIICKQQRKCNLIHKRVY